MSIVFIIYHFFRFNTKNTAKEVNYIYLLAILILLWGLVSDFLINNNSLDRVYDFLAKLCLPVLASYLVYFFINRYSSLKNFLYVVYLSISLSGFFGIMQFFFGGWFYEVVPHPQSHTEPLQIFGLYGIQHIFASQLGSTVPLIVSLLPSAKDMKKKIILMILLLITTLALLLTFVRSAIYGAFASIIIYLIIKKRAKMTKIGILILVLFILIFEVLPRINIKATRMYTVEESALYRISFWVSSFHIIKDNFWGVGRGNYSEAAEIYLDEISSYPGYEIVLRTTPHNQFLNILVYWGFPGFIFLIIFYYLIIRELNNVRKKINDRVLQNISIGLLCSFIAYLINSMFHNNGAFTGDPFHWFIISISLSLINLSKKYEAAR
jgi:O-antigen ligase